MKIAIVTDSTCDLPGHMLEEMDIHVVPALLNVGLEAYRDGIEITRTAYYGLLPTLPDVPHTSAPAPGTFETLYRELLREAETVVSIHVASTLSSIYSAASVGAQAVDAERIVVMDSGQTSMGLGWAVVAGARASQAGRDVAAVQAHVVSTLQKVRVFAIFNTMEYLKKGGRVSWLKANASELLHVKPMVELHRGEVLSRGRVRTWSKAVARLADQVRELGDLSHLAVMHSNCPDCVPDLLEIIQDRLPIEPPLTVDVTPIIGNHVGPHALGVAAVLLDKRQD